MIALTYISTSTMDFSDEDLVKLLEVAHENNAKENISGLLLYNGANTFIQVLEGDDEKVDALYQHIKKDERHRRVTRLSRESIVQRSFSDWKMGFRKLNSTISNKLEAYSNYWDKDANNEDFSNLGAMSQRLLQSFRDESKELIF